MTIDNHISTKKEVCETWLKNIAKQRLNMKDPIILSDIPQDFARTSDLAAVCMVHLGLIQDPELLELAKSKYCNLLASTHIDGVFTSLNFNEHLAKCAD